MVRKIGKKFMINHKRNSLCWNNVVSYVMFPPIYIFAWSKLFSVFVLIIFISKFQTFMIVRPDVGSPVNLYFHPFFRIDKQFWNEFGDSKAEYQACWFGADGNRRSQQHETACITKYNTTTFRIKGMIFIKIKFGELPDQGPTVEWSVRLWTERCNVVASKTWALVL